MVELNYAPPGRPRVRLLLRLGPRKHWRERYLDMRHLRYLLDLGLSALNIDHLLTLTSPGRLPTPLPTAPAARAESNEGGDDDECRASGDHPSEDVGVVVIFSRCAAVGLLVALFEQALTGTTRFAVCALCVALHLSSQLVGKYEPKFPTLNTRFTSDSHQLIWGHAGDTLVVRGRSRVIRALWSL